MKVMNKYISLNNFFIGNFIYSNILNSNVFIVDIILIIPYPINFITIKI